MIVTIKKVDKSVSWGAIDPKTNKLKPKYDNCADKWVPALTKSGRLNTGLTEKEAADFEKKLNLEPGSMSPEGKFWDNYRIPIPEGGLTIDASEGPLEALKIKLLSADPTVCKSPEEVKRNARAEYIMTNEAIEAKENNVSRDIKMKAWSQFAQMTHSDMLDALYLLGKIAHGAEDTDKEVIKDRIGKIVEKDPKKFLDTVGDGKAKEKIFVLKLIREGIVKKQTMGEGLSQPLYFEDIRLGDTLDEALDYLKAPENSTVYLGLQKALKAVK
jgi:hypothetical protein